MSDLILINISRRSSKKFVIAEYDSSPPIVSLAALILVIRLSMVVSVAAALAMSEAILLHSEPTSLFATRLLPRARLPARPCSDATIARILSFTGPSGSPAARFARAVA